MSERIGEPVIEPDAALVEAVRLHCKERRGALPRMALFLFDCADPASLRRTIARVPGSLAECLEDVVVMHEPSSQASLDPDELGAGGPFEVRIHRNPRDHGYGGARKAAFEYALHRGLDWAITLRGDGAHPPERLPDLIHAALLGEGGSVFAARRRVAGGASGLARNAATTALNRVLGLRLQDYQTGYRAYSTAALRRIPYQLNAGDRRFDVQIAIQLRALGVPIDEVRVEPAWREDQRGGEGWGQAAAACATALDYRLHQLHLTRRGRFFVDQEVFYTLKRSRTGSHMQIVDAIKPGSLVLDLGCSQGLLARPLRDQDVRVIGVDARPAEELAAELDAYYRRDLEEPLELPTGRSFDYVVCSDVIEHLRNRRALLRSVRRFLKPGGVLIISTPNVALWFYRLSLLIGRFEYGPRGVLDEGHVHLFTRASFRREVELAGFHILRERGTALPFEVVFASTGRSRLLRAVGRLYHALARAWPELFAYQFILEAEITTLDDESTAI